jgi:hypothetical protein
VARNMIKERYEQVHKLAYANHPQTPPFDFEKEIAPDHSMRLKI